MDWTACSAARTIRSLDAYSGYGAQWGYFTDSGEPLELLGHRYYDAASGRFVTRDPIGYDGGCNVYRYAVDCPTGAADSSGLFVDAPPGLAGTVGTVETGVGTVATGVVDVSGVGTVIGVIVGVFGDPTPTAGPCLDELHAPGCGGTAPAQPVDCGPGAVEKWFNKINAGSGGTIGRKCFHDGIAKLKGRGNDVCIDANGQIYIKTPNGTPGEDPIGNVYDVAANCNCGPRKAR